MSRTCLSALALYVIVIPFLPFHPIPFIALLDWHLLTVPSISCDWSRQCCSCISFACLRLQLHCVACHVNQFLTRLTLFVLSFHCVFVLCGCHCRIFNPPFFVCSVDCLQLCLMPLISALSMCLCTLLVLLCLKFFDI